MKTATLHDLQIRLHAVLAWVKGGKDVMVKGEPVVRAEVPGQNVDWNQSAAFRDRTGEPVLTQQDLDELFEEMRGPY